MLMDILYIGKNFIVESPAGKKYRITNITSTHIFLNDSLALTYKEFQECFKVEKVVVY